VVLASVNSYFNEHPALPLHNNILSWSVWNRELMLDALFIKESFNVGIPKLRLIVTSHFLDLQITFILSSSCKLLEDLLGFTFISQKEHPSEARKIINN